MIAQRDGGGVKKYGVKVDEAPVADGDVETVIAPKRVLDKGLSEAFKKVAVEAMALRDVEKTLVIYFGECAQTVQVGLDEFRVAGVIVLPGNHLVTVACSHVSSPRRCARILVLRCTVAYMHGVFKHAVLLMELLHTSGGQCSWGFG